MSDDINKTEMTDEADGYQVLARKYRPKSFEDMIGHGAMVKTLENSFSSGRIAQSYILTGIRGIGKTTTARILARALNYVAKDGSVDKPTTNMPELGVHCQDIMDSRHIDVIEMDAASKTGIGDIREIIESVRYKPVNARYKVYIIDEVHMLTTAAFNGLLKTLEEPPEHVKFIFATTEIQKIPVTILSRCQRFDLRRIDAIDLKALFDKISKLENATVSDEALSIIAQASEGSARDGLSILDQAIAMNNGKVEEVDVRRMLGVADKMRIFSLYEHILGGNIAEALVEFKDQYDEGADPYRILSELADVTHWVTRLKVIPDLDDRIWSKEAHDKGREFANKLSMRTLAKTWQMLLKGMEEVKSAAKPFAAAEMALIRLSYSAQLPNPDDVIKKLMEKPKAGQVPPPNMTPSGGNGSNTSNMGGSNAQANGQMGDMSGSGAPTAQLLPFNQAGQNTALKMDVAQQPSEPETFKDNVVALRPENNDLANDGFDNQFDDYFVEEETTISAMDDAAFYDVDEDLVAEMGHQEVELSLDHHNYSYSPTNMVELISLCSKKRELLIRRELRNHVLLVSFEVGKLVLKPLPGADKEMPKNLSHLLTEWCGEKWLVIFDYKAEPIEQDTILQRELAQFAAQKDALSQENLIAHILKEFDGSYIDKIIDLNDNDE